MHITPPPPSIPYVLRRKLDQIRGRNPSYSLRAFAKKLSIHPAALSEILNGKRIVSTKLALRLVSCLDLTEAEREQILSFAAQGSLLKKLGKEQTAVASQLAMDQYFLVAEWYYYAILSLAEIKGFKANAKYISQRLGLSLDIADKALDRLTRLGYFEQKKGRLVPQKNVRLSTTTDIASDSLRRRHEINLQAAQEALRNVPIELREFTFITMAIDLKKLKFAKPIIREFREKLCAFLEDGEKTDVYEFCMSLFPRTVLSETMEKRK